MHSNPHCHCTSTPEDSSMSAIVNEPGTELGSAGVKPGLSGAHRRLWLARASRRAQVVGGPIITLPERENKSADLAD